MPLVKSSPATIRRGLSEYFVARLVKSSNATLLVLRTTNSRPAMDTEMIGPTGNFRQLKSAPDNLPYSFFHLSKRSQVRPESCKVFPMKGKPRGPGARVRLLVKTRFQRTISSIKHADNAKMVGMRASKY